MRKLIYPLIALLILSSCSEKNAEETILEDNNPDFCACMNPGTEIAEKCAELYPPPTTEEEKQLYAERESDCIENSDLETFADQPSEEPVETEEELEPVSPECEKFVSEYSAAIKSFTALAKKAQANPDDITLKIQYMNSSEEISGWASKPMMFECSQNQAFKNRIEELNTTRDKLLSN